MNLLIFRVRGQKSRPSFTLTSMEIIVNVMNSELLSLFGSHLAHIVSVAHDERSSDMLHVCMLCVVVIISMFSTN